MQRSAAQSAAMLALAEIYTLFLAGGAWIIEAWQDGGQANSYLLANRQWPRDLHPKVVPYLCHPCLTG